MKDLEFELPESDDGQLDSSIMKAWSNYREELDRIDAEFTAVTQGRSVLAH